MTTYPRDELGLTPPHRGWAEHGMLEIHYVGVVDEDTTRIVSARAIDPAASYFVYLIDVSNLEAFTPAARKVFSKMRVPEGPSTPTMDKVDLHFYLVGATLKTKAIFALVLAASRLIGPIRLHTKYLTDLDAARVEARAKRDELITTGAIPPPIAS